MGGRLAVVVIAAAAARRVDRVDVFAGSGGFGFGYGSNPPAAQRPRGLARASPDTCRADGGAVGFEHFSGYHPGDAKVRTFSHMHLNGAGVADYGAIGVMPFRGPPVVDASRIDQYAYASLLADQTASPGYYSAHVRRAERPLMNRGDAPAVETSPSFDESWRRRGCGDEPFL